MLRPKVIISSTMQNLPEHRKEVMDGCLRQGMFPQMMEHLAANDADAITASLRMVDDADLYVGIFAHRYGYVPEGYDISITEMEYNRAVERRIPRLIFLMHDEHPIKIGDVEIGDGTLKLKALINRLTGERVVNFFKSPADLRAHIVNSLSQYRTRQLAPFHHISDIPTRPETYIAHPYTLLQTRDLVGRYAELNLLTDWIAKPDSEVYKASILNIVAIGGMGKSALTWKWFNDIAPNEIKNLSGQMWWSFYESDATFENFVIRALAYVTNRTIEEIETHTTPGDREDKLWSWLDREPFLLVLDGMERILVAYARMDASRLADDELNQKTANAVVGTRDLPASAAESFIGQHPLRKTANPRVGNFLRKLARVRASKILVSTRLYPADLQARDGKPIPGSFPYFLRGLSDDDALSLWRSSGVNGSRDELLQLFQTFEKHPLLIQVLASEVACYRPAPRDFKKWRQSHQDFNPFRLPLVQVKSHVLAFALQRLESTVLKVLHTIAAFRMPASYDTLVALMVAKGKPFANENALDISLTELEDRGLLGWDRRANRYDLHPVVRGVVWCGLDDITKKYIYGEIEPYFNSIPPMSEQVVRTFDDLTPVIELYNSFIGLGWYDAAIHIFRERIQYLTLHRLSATRQRAELLEMLFPETTEKPPRLYDEHDQAFTLDNLALSYDLSGEPGRAVPFYHRSIRLHNKLNKIDQKWMALNNLADALRLAGALRESEGVARQAVGIAQERSKPLWEAVSLISLGLTMATRGRVTEAELMLEDSLRTLEAHTQVQSKGIVNAFLAEITFLLGDYDNAYKYAETSSDLAQVNLYARDLIRGLRLLGAVSLAKLDLKKAETYLSQALTKAREVSFVEEELCSLINLSQLRLQDSDIKSSLELLDDVWEAVERGPYPIFHADAFNQLAEIEETKGNISAALEAAEKAYCISWCDGPPFAYYRGLKTSETYLRNWNRPVPSGLPSYDESKYEPMIKLRSDITRRRRKAKDEQRRKER